MPNEKNITRVINEIKAEEIMKFDMTTWSSHVDLIKGPPPCGTSGCIGGFCEELIQNDSIAERNKRYFVSDHEVANFLGIEYSLAKELLFSEKSHFPLIDITRDMVITALEDLKIEKFHLWVDYYNPKTIDYQI